jgi:RNA-directed DNA polymerase
MGTSDRLRLALLGLPPIDSLEDFSTLTHLSKGLLYRLSRFPDLNYFTYAIPKKKGGQRTIAQPSAEMKAVQVWILRNILHRLTVSSACKGFERLTNIGDNARPHIGAQAVMCLDLEDFFPTIRVNQVWSVFRTLGYSPRMSAVIASLCTYKGVLPQGSPASPKLANLVCLRLDARLSGYAGRRGIVYTRYADDLNFSSLSYARLGKSYPFIKKIVRAEGFSLNDSKTRLAGPARQHRITGLIVNDSQAGIGRVRLRQIRSKINHLCRHSKAAAPHKDVAHVEGWLAFVNGVDKKRHAMLMKYVTGMQAKYPQSAVSMLSVTM